LVVGHLAVSAFGIVKRATINMAMQYLSCILIYTPLNICLRVVWWGYTVSLFLGFWRGGSGGRAPS
jgi:hypothetical protein